QGVLLAGLGTFGTVREPLRLDTDEVLEIRRPVFHMDMDMVWLQGLKYRKVTLPGEMAIKPLDLERLSRATSYSQQVVEGCVEETIRLFSSHMRKKENIAFAFGDVGVLARQRDKVHMRFFAHCTQWLEGTASLIAGLRS
ncbi:CCD81 protein, partial [Nothoprocta ornata]|nr:CCD81 protein [Nothoprocta pentlandii]NWY07638.1 CCD81 protein [Nothoprocta ornata]